MESQKIINLLDHKDGDYPKFQTKKWYIINDRNNGQYSQGEEYDPAVKIDTEDVEPFLCDYTDAYILVIGDIKVVGGDTKTKAFKNCHPFTRSEIHVNVEHVETADNLDLSIKMYNLVEYSDNYPDPTASLYQFKRQEPLPNNASLTTAGSSSFKYKSDLLGNSTVAAASPSPNIPQAHRVWKNAKIIVQLSYISVFFRCLQLSLINTKLYIQLN